MIRMLDIAYGWIIKNEEEKFLGSDFQWEKVRKTEAHIHQGETRNDQLLKHLEIRTMGRIFCAYPAMVVNGQVLIGPSIFKKKDGSFEFPGK